MKKFYSILFIFMISMLLTGCLEIDYYISVNKDGTKKVLIKIKYSVLAESYLPDINMKLKEKGYSVGESYDITDEKFDKIIIAEKTYGIDEVVMENMELYPVKYGIFTRWVLNYTDSETNYDESDSEYAIPVKFNINMPGFVIESNSLKTVDGNLYWEYYLNNPLFVMHAESIKINYFFSLICLAGLVSFLLLLTLIARKQNKSH